MCVCGYNLEKDPKKSACTSISMFLHSLMGQGMHFKKI